MPSCGLANLGACLPQVFFDFILTLINEPIQPFLQLTLNLLSEPINLSLFLSLWVIIVYLLSMFYALLLVGSGITFLISGYDVEKREQAKGWLRNIVIMIILVQSSFFIYGLFIDLSSTMTSAVLSLIDPAFFTISASSVTGLGLTILLSLFYLIALILTTLVLTLRYAVVAIGVVLFPIGIFFYFLPPMKSFGSLILNLLGISMFITFIDAILLVGFSALMNISTFSSLQIIVLISVFLLIDILMFVLLFFAISRAVFSVYSQATRWRS
ncbi:MAG: hypothetical protein ACP5NS_01325 [Candidatus Pacearchaeota archaeon]